MYLNVGESTAWSTERSGAIEPLREPRLTLGLADTCVSISVAGSKIQSAPIKPLTLSAGLIFLWWMSRASFRGLSAKATLPSGHLALSRQQLVRNKSHLVLRVVARFLCDRLGWPLRKRSLSFLDVRGRSKIQTATKLAVFGGRGPSCTGCGPTPRS